jgi:Na+-driven multidrug efflux pump
LWGKQIAMLFIKEPHIIEMSVYILRFLSWSYLFAGANITLATYYTAIDSPLISGILTTFRTLVALLISLLVLPSLIGEVGIWLSVPLSEIMTILLGIWYIKNKEFGALKIINSNNPKVVNINENT